MENSDQALPKHYTPAQIEEKWRAQWEAKQIFKYEEPAEDEDQDAYCIVLPPPNVTGTLHMGHAFQTTLIDALIRYHKMSGRKVLWQGGTDHAGIATQMVVERELEKENLDRHDLGREEFISRVWTWKNKSGDSIQKQLRRLGCAIDWSRDHFTMDPTFSAGVQQAFVHMYRQGLIYQGEKLANWDPKLQTVVSDLEVEYREEKAKLYHIRYPIVDSQEVFVVATTRPETLFGDSAIAVNPEDERYLHLVGKQAIVPLTSRRIPIITDEAVDKEFGTGCLKITPAHDFNDFEVGLRHNLERISIMDDRGYLNTHVPPAYQGLERFKARRQIIEDLSEQELLVEAQDYILRVPRGDRSQEILEPKLTKQWFVDTTSQKTEDGKLGGKLALVQPAIEAVQQQDISFIPQHWQNTYFRWMENLHDWCISRQIWWGHRIPAWYDNEGQVYVGLNQADVIEHYKLPAEIELKQDKDVLDTWFSSALWPFASLDWPQSSEVVKVCYPTSVLVTGFDIIFFWVARMIMFGIYFQKEIPFHQVYIHGLVRDTHNQKMSKSRGNVIDPLDLIDGIELARLVEKRTESLMQPKLKQTIAKQTQRDFPQGIAAYGCDSLRYALTALASTGRDIRLDIKKVESGRNFCNKLWNAARFLLMQAQNNPIVERARQQVNQKLDDENWQPKYTHPSNLWLDDILQKTTLDTQRYYKNYRFDLLAKSLYEFTWDYYCDWYLEIGKYLISQADDEIVEETALGLYWVFERMLRLLHPIIPFISEEIHSHLFTERTQFLCQLPYPQTTKASGDELSFKLMENVCGIVGTIRQARSLRMISPADKTPVWIHHQNPEQFQAVLQFEPLMAHLSHSQSIQMIDEQKQSTSLHLYQDLKIHLPIENNEQVQAELQRLNKEKEKNEKRLAVLDKKLKNESYVRGAPAEIVELDRQEQTLLGTQLKEILIQIDHVSYVPK